MAIHLNGTIVDAPIWGKHKPVFLTTWSEIKKLGFHKRDRAFGSLRDGRPALFFQPNPSFLTKEQMAECEHDWYVTTEDYDSISD